jgi:predicted O-linked N-acetylglucosamine transferase (SPINDLY family)
LYRAGWFDEADSRAAEVLASDAADVEAQQVRALVALERGRLDEALRLVKQALAGTTDAAGLHMASGRIHARLGKAELARRAFVRALELDDACGDAHLGLGLLAIAARKEGDAITRLSAAVRCAPELAEAHFQLGNLSRGRNDAVAAEQHYRRAIERDPEHAEALCNLGGLLNDRGRVDEATVMFERAIAADATLAPALYNLALIRIGQRRWADAASLLSRAVASDGSDPDAHYWLGNARMGDGDASSAREAYQAAFRRRADHVQARWGHAMAQLPSIPSTDDEQRDAVANFAKETERLAQWVRSHPAADAVRAVGAQQPFYLAYIAGNHRAPLATYGKLCTTIMAAWSRRVGVPAPVVASSGRCKLGIVSAHVNAHSVWNAIVRGWVEHLDPARFELHLFHVGETRDAETEWATRRVRHFHHRLGGWEQWSKAISDSRLDAIVYPEIAMDATTLRLATLRLARVQLAAWGHPVTTGLPTIDGYVSAEAFEPPDADDHYTEPLIRLPRLGCCYRSFGTRASDINLRAWRLDPDDRLLLCAGSAFKYAPRDDALLIDIARRCAPCKLVFFDTRPVSIARRLETRLRSAFEAAGVDFDTHVRFVPWLDQAAFFGLLDRATVYLDTIGFSGFNTTMQAIERAVPIVAWEGAALRGRFASGILRQIDLHEWIAHTHEGFVERVARLCDDTALRERVKAAIVQRRSTLFHDRAAVDAFATKLLAMTAAR